MPLPKPPAKKGDLLRSADYEAQAAPRAEKRSLKTRGAEAPAQAMPQAVAAESSLGKSPIAGGGVATIGAGVLLTLQNSGDQVATVTNTVKQTKALAVDALGISPDYFLPLVLVGVGAVVVWQRFKQRREGWA